MHFTARQALDTYGVRDAAGCWCGGAVTAMLTLAAGDTAENPTTPEFPIHGPAALVYAESPAGSISTVVRYGQPIFAGDDHLQPV
jgi:hypothetical protein